MLLDTDDTLDPNMGTFFAVAAVVVVAAAVVVVVAVSVQSTFSDLLEES